MVAAEVQFYEVIVWLHVSAVVLAFGPTFAFGIYLAFIGRNHPRSIPAVLEAQGVVVRTLTTGGALVVLASGIYLTADRWDFDEFFIGWGIIAVLVLLGLSHGFFLPNDRNAQEAAERDIAATEAGEVSFGAEFWKFANRSRRVGPIAGLIVILTIYVMTTKPFL